MLLEMKGRTVTDSLIAEIKDRIVAAFHPRRVILFGSRGRGDFRTDSDVDLFIEMDTTEPRWKRRWIVDDLFPRRWWPMDLYILNSEEVRAARDSSISILPTIESEGKVLYEQPAR